MIMFLLLLMIVVGIGAAMAQRSLEQEVRVLPVRSENNLPKRR